MSNLRGFVGLRFEKQIVNWELFEFANRCNLNGRKLFQVSPEIAWFLLWAAETWDTKSLGGINANCFKMLRIKFTLNHILNSFKRSWKRHWWWDNVIAINRDVSTSWQTHSPLPLGLRSSSRPADEILPYLWPFQTPREPQIVSRRIFFYKNISTTFPILAARKYHFIIRSDNQIMEETLHHRHPATECWIAEAFLGNEQNKQGVR